MKEKNRIIADKHRKLPIQKSKKLDPIRSDQVVNSENKEKIRKLCRNKFPNGPVIEKADNKETDNTANTVEKQGSHSLSQLHFFQNHHK